jgi:hypothetical protein
MAARFKKNKPMGGGRVPVIPEVQPAYGASQIGVRNMPAAPPMGALDKGSAAIWNVLSAVGGLAKDEFNTLKNDPMGTLNATIDSLTIGQEARDRFKKGDVAGAINYSGLGQLAALPEMEKVFKGKAGPMDALWLALTYGTGGAGKIAKSVTTPVKRSVKKGSNKAYINILNRLK